MEINTCGVFEMSQSQRVKVYYLDQEPQVDILALRLLPVYLTVLVVSDVNSLEKSTETH